VSSIYRELSRNKKSGVYLSHHADIAAQKRRQASKPRPKRENARLMAEIEKRLKQDHSPEQIAGRLKLEHPEESFWHVSHETIYQHVYSRIRAGADLKAHLRQGRKKRRKRLSRKDKRGVIPDRVFIDKRPAIVDRKERIGDWEGDTIEGSRKKGYVATFTERKTKFLVAYPLARKITLGLVRQAKRAFRRIPEGKRKTLTVDNGKEFASHTDLGKAIKVDVYFAHPYHSWERGLNEHTNGLLRQYLPKSLSLEGLTKRQLAKIVDKINNRPRRSLGYRTPREVFFNLPFALRS
jgi:transposase, IS30 family